MPEWVDGALMAVRWVGELGVGELGVGELGAVELGGVELGAVEPESRDEVLLLVGGESVRLPDAEASADDAVEDCWAEAGEPEPDSAMWVTTTVEPAAAAPAWFTATAINAASTSTKAATPAIASFRRMSVIAPLWCGRCRDDPSARGSGTQPPAARRLSKNLDLSRA